MIKKRKKVFSVVMIALLLIGYFKLAYTPSHDVEEFPIPREAHLVKTTVGEDYVTEKYKWLIASEAGSIPPWYQVSIWLRGWRKGETMGADQVYKNGSRKVNLSTFDNEFYLSK
ncbi:hypothetical protein [Priestia aryabhattai]|uniref:hypothetical protein n=1 Tax=Priestia aryabhattai TaxID=412384 RepID=UPI00064EA62A|nr:hypothetical protein [Priestia aryabhattai]UPK52824.1 hypothetical protein MT476_26250 [Bacillus sp. H8-1]KML31382.1 hypothetical protein VL11_02160 [Priestia aryabhattai]KMN91413.1 hypothetical protein ABV89_27860 [Priestia aryabhattai]MDC7767133.1 hypothetical protein [Priestia aryabhattai]WKG33426.1 hypothetical protein QYS54_26635 [Priestia aryabhattai]